MSFWCFVGNCGGWWLRRLMADVFMFALCLTKGQKAHFLSESIVQLLHLPRKNSKVKVLGLKENCSNNFLYSVPIRIKSTEPCSTTLHTQAFVLPKITAYTPVEFTVWEIPYNLRDLELADPTQWEGYWIDLLIGADLYAQTLNPESCSGIPGNLVAQSTIFDWVLSGPLRRSPIQSYHINVHFSMENRTYVSCWHWHW